MIGEVIHSWRQGTAECRLIAAGGRVISEMKIGGEWRVQAGPFDVEGAARIAKMTLAEGPDAKPSGVCQRMLAMAVLLLDAKAGAG